MRSGAELILLERIRQGVEEQFTDDGDDLYTQGELATAAVCYLQHERSRFSQPRWPWAPEWFKPKSRLRNLVRAGALIAAEIDRLQRLAAQEVADGGSA